MESEVGADTLKGFIDDLPKLHSWDNGKTWNTGGFGPHHLNAIAKVLAELPRGFRAIETGAGNSTLLFLLCGAGSVVSIAPDVLLFDRIKATAEQRSIDCGALEAVVAFSEDVLPDIANNAARRQSLYDFALIDGGHGWPTVFVDFCYIMAALKPGGYLMIDDVQLFSVKQLARLLSESREFSVASNLGKSIIFRKDTKNARMTDFGAQPYITRMTESDRLAGAEYMLKC
jgi:hypothetical protein